MKSINSSVSLSNKVRIYSMIAIKLFRGFLNRWRFKSVKGFLLIGKRVSIYNAGSIVLGRNVKLENDSELQGLSTDGIFFGNNVTIGKNTMIRPSSYYGVGKIGEGITIGNNSSIGPMGYLGCAGKIVIGDNVMVGPRVSLFAENHSFQNIDETIKSQGVTNLGITIEDDCWIGSGVIILDGVNIGAGSVIAAGTIITRNVPPYSKVYDSRQKKTIDRRG